MKKVIGLLLVLAIMCNCGIICVAAVEQPRIVSPGEDEWLDISDDIEVVWTNPVDGVIYKMTILNELTGKYVMKDENVTGYLYTIKANTLEPGQMYKIWIVSYMNNEATGIGSTITITTRGEKNSPEEIPEETGNPQEEYKASDWAEAEVNKAKELDLIPEEMFDDDLTQNITRAELAAISVKLAQVNPYCPEPDIEAVKMNDTDNHKYENYIKEAYCYKNIYGVGTAEDGSVIFNPDAFITRQDVATIFCRMIVYMPGEYAIMWDRNPMETLDVSGVKIFEDDADISDYAKLPVYHMKKRGIVNGVDSTHFAPLGTTTREQAILLALRTYYVMYDATYTYDL